MDKPSQNIFKKIVSEKEDLVKIIEALKQGIPPEGILVDKSLVFFLGDPKESLKREISRKFDLPESRELAELVLNYRSFKLKEYTEYLRKLVVLAEKKAYRNHILKNLETKLLVKTLIISIVISITTAVALTTFPKLIIALMKKNSSSIDLTGQLNTFITITAMYASTVYTLTLVITKDKLKSKALTILILMTMMVIFIASNIYNP